MEMHGHLEGEEETAEHHQLHSKMHMSGFVISAKINKLTNGRKELGYPGKSWSLSRCKPCAF